MPAFYYVGEDMRRRGLEESRLDLKEEEWEGERRKVMSVRGQESGRIKWLGYIEVWEIVGGKPSPENSG